MMHDFLVSAVFVAIVMTPYVFAKFSQADDADTDTSSESDVMKDGFI